MYESGEQYMAVVRQKLLSLEKYVGHRVSHGEAGLCPKCGKDGTYDIDGLGFSGGDNSIYYSTVYYEWRCRVCDFKSCS